MTEKTHIVCTACGAVNATAAGRDPRRARCGSCAAPLFAGRPAAVDETAFNRQLDRSDVALLVDVWAPWCGPCRQMSPLFERAAAELEPQMRLLKLNADEAPETCARYGVRGIPALLLFDRGKLIAQAAGVMDTARIIAWARSHLPSPKETTS